MLDRTETNFSDSVSASFAGSIKVFFVSHFIFIFIYTFLVWMRQLIAFVTWIKAIAQNLDDPICNWCYVKKNKMQLMSWSEASIYAFVSLDISISEHTRPVRALDEMVHYELSIISPSPKKILKLILLFFINYSFKKFIFLYFCQYLNLFNKL